jgi:hypothetical protein
MTPPDLDLDALLKRLHLAKTRGACGGTSSVAWRICRVRARESRSGRVSFIPDSSSERSSPMRSAPSGPAGPAAAVTVGQEGLLGAGCLLDRFTPH